jgi:RNA polymerase sigma-70 factor (sigma-E family)
MQAELATAGGPVVREVGLGVRMTELDDVSPEVDRDAHIEALFASEYAGLCRVAALLTGDRARAEELVMDAFTSTLVGWRRIRDLDAAPAYLRRAVVNACRNAHARRGREHRANALSHAGDPHEMRLPEEVGHVLDAIRALPPRQRAAIVLTFYADLPEAEVAAALGCKPGTVKSQLSKARATLARTLSEEHGRG